MVPAAVAVFGPGDENDVEQLAFPEHVEPGVLNVVLQFFAGAFPFCLDVVKDRLLLDHRAFLGAHEGVQVKVPVFALLKLSFRDAAPSIPSRRDTQCSRSVCRVRRG